MKPLMKDIVRAAAEYFGVPAVNILSESRAQKFFVPRQYAMYLGRYMRGISLPEIGAAFGRDHTTAMKAIADIEFIISFDDKACADAIAVAALASKYAVERKEREREWVQTLHAGQKYAVPANVVPMVVPVPPETARRVLVPARSLPRVMPSDLRKPALAQLMGRRA